MGRPSAMTTPVILEFCSTSLSTAAPVTSATPASAHAWKIGATSARPRATTRCSARSASSSQGNFVKLLHSSYSTIVKGSLWSGLRLSNRSPSGDAS